MIIKGKFSSDVESLASDCGSQKNRVFLILAVMLICVSVASVEFVSAEKMWNFNNHTVNISDDLYFGGQIFGDGSGLTNLNVSALDLTGYVPYTGAISNLDLGNNNFSVGGSDLFVDTDLGYVGIGTNNPQYALHINQLADSKGIRINGYDDEASSYLDFGINNFGSPYFNVNSAGGAFAMNSDGAMVIDTGSYLRLRAAAANYVELADNNNANVRMVMGGGNVGIGMTSSGYKLDVNGSINANDFLINGTSISAASLGAISGSGVANRLAFWNGTDTLSSDLDLTWDGFNFEVDGRVGLADGNMTHPSLFFIDEPGQNTGIYTASQELHFTVNGNDALVLGSSGNILGPSFVATLTAGSADAPLFATETHTAGLYRINDGTSNLQFATTDANRMTITSTGKIGLNTTNPQNTFNVIGDGNFTGDLFSNGLAVLTSATLSESDPLWTGNFTLYNSSWTSTYNATYDAYNSSGLIKDWNVDGYIQDWNSTGLIKNWSSAGDLSGYVPFTGATSNLDLGNNNFSVGGSDLFVDSDLGRVGIGTSSPLNPFHVDAGSTPGTLINVTTTGDYAHLQMTSSYSTVQFGSNVQVGAHIGSTSGAGISFTDSGRVYPLQNMVATDNYADLGSSSYRFKTGYFKRLDVSSTYGGVFKMDDVATGNIIMDSPSYDIDFQTNGVSRLWIDNSGNVGIGTNTSQNTLNVIGDGNFTGDLFSNGAQVLTSFSETDSLWTGNFTNGLTGNLILNGNYLSGDGGDEGLFVASNGFVGIGDIVPDSLFDVEGMITSHGVQANAAENLTLDGTTGTGDVIIRIG